MSEKIIIRLPKDMASPVAWLIADSTATEVIASGVVSSAQALHELADKAAERKVFVTVASDAITMHQAEVPAKSRRHLQQLLPFTLEDEVAQDIDSLHFAWPSATAANEPIPVAVVAKTQMQQWLDALAAANITVSALVPEFLLLPYEQDRWTLCAFNDTWVMRQSHWQGLCIEPSWLAHIVYDESELPAEILILGELHWPTDIAMPAPMRALDADLPLLLMLQQWPQAHLNLCQGAFTQKRKRQFNVRFLRWPAIAASLLFVVYLVHVATTKMEVEQQTRLVQQAIEARYFEIFPEQKRMPPDARRRMEQHPALSGGLSQGALLSMLNDLVPAFQEAKLTLTLLNYDSNQGELRIRATGRSFQTFEKFQRAVREQALDVEQGQLVSRDSKIIGTLTVRRPS